ncbi:acyltransferase [Dysgonomonas sp. 25]|uniref:acyltransferase family protein n=1 Tax=Dysgonomonas sp. 25 TaxID=2302933 RepID=UPI0013D3428A|nr:acyltransferase family protein [Dysgonomonas sp. 25]NDV69274.1 acyltransferase [Dysgonomonas sp. 25]
MKKIEKLDAIRGLVALYVMFHHIFYAMNFEVGDFYVGGIFGYGSAAVMVFFILSGFVIQYSHQQAKDQSFKLFFFKRFFRIYIPLICVFILNFFILYIEGKAFGINDCIDLIGNLIMLQDTPLINPNHTVFDCFLGNGPLWSLTFEWWFYIFYFFLYKYKRNQASLIVYTLAIISALTIIYPIFLNRFFIFLVLWWSGVEIAKLYTANKKITFITMLKPLSVILICTIVMNFILRTDFDNTYRGVFTPSYNGLKYGLMVLCGGIIWHYFKWRFFNQTIGVFKYFANISYGIYISHWFLVSHASYLNFIDNSIIRYSLYILICFAFSYLIERVIYVRLNKYFMKRIFHK